MDFSKFKTSDWLMIGGGIGIFIFGFFNWVTVSGFGFSSSGGNVFDFFFTGTIPWFLVIASAVITVLLVQGILKADQAPWPLILLVATGLAALLLLLRIIFNPIDGKDADRIRRRRRRPRDRHDPVGALRSRGDRWWRT